LGGAFSIVPRTYKKEANHFVRQDISLPSPEPAQVTSPFLHSINVSLAPVSTFLSRKALVSNVSDLALFAIRIQDHYAQCDHSYRLVRFFSSILPLSLLIITLSFSRMKWFSIIPTAALVYVC
jgi:hypothetical protein